MKRRQFLWTSAATLLAAGRSAANSPGDWSLRIGVTDWDLLGIHYFQRAGSNGIITEAEREGLISKSRIVRNFMRRLAWPVF